MRGIITVVTLVCVATAARAQSAEAIAREAARARAEQRPCDELYYRLEMLRLSKLRDPNFVPVNSTMNAALAAELANAWGIAIPLFRVVADKSPDPGLVEDARARADALQRRLTAGESPAVCPSRPPECGNGIVEGSERCDDGNVVDDATCPVQCSIATVEAAPPPPASPPPPPPSTARAPAAVTAPAPPAAEETSPFFYAGVGVGAVGALALIGSGIGLGALYGMQSDGRPQSDGGPSRDDKEAGKDTAVLLAVTGGIGLVIGAAGAVWAAMVALP